MNKTAPLAVLAGLAALSLAACVPGITTDGTTSTPTPSATATADETPLDPDVLFTISTTATDPSGAVAELVQTVYKPVASTDEQALDEEFLDGECPGWRGEYPTAEYLISLVDVTDKSPDGVAWESDTRTGPIAVVSLNGWPSFRGEVEPFQSYCASVQVNLGASRGVTPVAPASGSDGHHGWAHILYGFGIATEAGTATPGPYDVLLSDCEITLSEEAATSPIASSWAWDGNPLSCSFGEYDYGP